MNESWSTTGDSFVTVFARRRLRGLGRLEYRWHCQAPNGEIVCTGEGYVRRIDAMTAALRHHPRVEAEG